MALKPLLILTACVALVAPASAEGFELDGGSDGGDPIALEEYVFLSSSGGRIRVLVVCVDLDVSPPSVVLCIRPMELRSAPEPALP